MKERILAFLDNVYALSTTGRTPREICDLHVQNLFDDGSCTLARHESGTELAKHLTGRRSWVRWCVDDLQG